MTLKFIIVLGKDKFNNDISIGGYVNIIYLNDIYDNDYIKIINYSTFLIYKPDTRDPQYYTDIHTKHKGKSVELSKNMKVYIPNSPEQVEQEYYIAIDYYDYSNYFPIDINIIHNIYNKNNSDLFYKLPKKIIKPNLNTIINEKFIFVLYKLCGIDLKWRMVYFEVWIY